jgi:hypothetical protein
MPGRVVALSGAAILVLLCLAMKAQVDLLRTLLRLRDPSPPAWSPPWHASPGCW